MPLKPCAESGCPNLSDQPRCALHRRDPNRSWSRDRDHAAHKRFARAVKQRDVRCVNCGADTDLQAHHLYPGYNDPATGVLLCRSCHKAVDSHAR